MSKEHDFGERARQNAMNALHQQQSNAFNNPFYRQQYAEAMRPVMTEEQKKRHKAKLDETRQLKGHPSNYLTGLEPSGERIEYWDSAFFKHQGVDLDKFKIVDQILNAKIVG